MYEVSAAFAAAMKNRPYVAKLTLDGNEEISGNAIQDIVFRGGTNGKQDAFSLGGTVSGSVEISLNKGQVAYTFQDREIKVELGMELGSGTEWLPMGVYYATEPLVDDDLLTVTALDALGTRFEREYETIPGFEFGTDTGVSSTAFLRALCARRGVTVDVSNLSNFQLKAPPDGFTERQIIGFIAALYGGFANIDRAGILRIRSYSECEAKVTADEYYEGGMEKADYDFSVQWLKCYNENTDLTMFVGDLNAEQGIYLQSIWMDYTILNDLLDKLQGFSYRPVTELSFLGNPLIDPGDIISMEDLAGETIKVPVMNISHEYDGGIITRVTANGQAKTEAHASSTQREIRRLSAAASKSAVDAQTQQDIFNKLTDNGNIQGIYMQDNKWYINAELAKIVNLIADHVRSVSGSSILDIDGAELQFLSNGKRTVQLTNMFEGLPILYMTDYESGVETDNCELSPHHLSLGGTSFSPIFSIQVSGGKVHMWLNGDSAPKELSWKSNGDGTYSLIGR